MVTNKRGKGHHITDTDIAHKTQTPTIASLPLWIYLSGPRDGRTSTGGEAKRGEEPVMGLFHQVGRLAGGNNPPQNKRTGLKGEIAFVVFASDGLG
jgi:hypothetical protein